METNTSTPPPMAEGAVNMSAPPVQPASVPVSAPVPAMAEGGQVSSSDTSFFKNINWLQVGFMILGSAALISVIYHYKIIMEKTKLENERLAKQIDEVKMNVQSQMKGKYKEIV